jgi:DNA-directed RNA polymerase subunit omega
MARITIEDCMEKVPNRFQLVQMAAIRAKQLKKGARPLLGSEENKEVVMSLREIAAGLVKPGDAEPEPVSVSPAAPSDAAEAEDAAAGTPAESTTVGES